MDFRERILTTFNHEEPDRVPVMSLLMEPSNVSNYTGEKQINYFNYLKKPILKSIIKILMNWDLMWNSNFLSVYSKIVDLNIELGFDACWMYYLVFKLKSDKTSNIGYTWYDLWGRKWEITLDRFGNPEPQYIGGYCSTEEDWEKWIANHEGMANKFIKSVEKFYKNVIQKYKNQIYIIGFAAPGVFENSWQPIGFVNFTKYMYSNPKFIKKVIEFQKELYLKQIEGICNAGNEIVLIGDDLGHKTGLLMSPKLIDKYFGDVYREIAEFIHNKNKKVLFHSCGKLYELLDRFIDWGFDGLLTLEPTAGMELGAVRKKVGHKLVLVGNIDVSYLLVRGTKLEIEKAVKKAIEDAAKGGGFILSPAHSHADVDINRLKWMIEAAHNYGNYPIT
ncbi:MAG: uroporphyrinogen decarboxylase family protein [Candidatus Helarchaeota archaeon]